MPSAQKPKVQIAVPEDTRGREGPPAPNVTSSTQQQANPASGAEYNGSFRSSNHSSPTNIARLTNGGRRSFAATLWNPMTEAEKAQFNKRRFVQLVAGIFMGVTVGVQYAFGIVSADLKVRAGFKQSDMTTITTVGNCLFAFSFPAGVLFDYMGPTAVLLCAMAFGCTGFILLALIFGGVIAPTVAVVAIANGLPNWQAGFLESGTLLPSLFMFPTNKGEVVILQKTFFGLGSTFLSLSYDGFFSGSDDYKGYCIYVCCIIFVAISFGAAVTRLPTYKRTVRELNAIKHMSPVDAARAQLMEEQSFEMHHNPRLSDRRRLNFGVTVLLVTLVFFTSLSFIKSFVHIESHIVMGLTFVAVLCIASFAIMLVPGQLPAFFDYEFLPDMHAPEELVDKPPASAPRIPSSPVREGALSNKNNGKEHEKVPLKSAEGTSREGNIYSSVDSLTRSPQSAAIDIVSHSPKGDVGALLGANTSVTLSFTVRSSQSNDGRASQFYNKRASVAGGSLIAVPAGVSPLVMASIATPFLQTLRSPFIWCFWFTAFSVMGTNFVFVNNIAQIYAAINNGEFVKSTNSLNVALIGIGSAVGRILAGFGETYLHRINAMRRERQLEALAKQELGITIDNDESDEDEVAATPDATTSQNMATITNLKKGRPAKVPVDMTPIHHRWSSSIVFVLPLSPLMVGIMCLCTLFIPASGLGIIFMVYSVFVGMFLALLALSIREIFSVDVAMHLNFILSAGILATVLLNRVMFGMWYDEEFERQTNNKGSDILIEAYGNAQLGHSLFGDSINTTTTSPAKSNDCAGVSCIRNSMLVLASINGVAVASALYVVIYWWRVRKTFV